MANGNRWSMSYKRRFTAFALMALGLFIASFGVGFGSPAVIVLGLAVGILGPAILLLTAVRATTRQYVFGTAHVYSASPPPSAGMVGRAELHLAVFADGIDGVAVRVLDPAVPVSKWPDDGATLPIEVVANNPRKVRVLWDQVVTHAQAAGEDLYPQHVEDLPADLDDDYDDLPPDDFLDGPDDLLDEERLPPPPPSPPPSMPSGPLANVEGAGADFAPVPAPMLVPAAAEPPVGTPPKVAAGPQVKPVSPAPAPVAVAHQDAEFADEEEPAPDDDPGWTDPVDDPPGYPESIDAVTEPAGSASAPPAGAFSDGPAVSLPLPRRLGRPSPHLRRPSPRPRKSVDNRTGEPRAETGSVRTGGINPVYVEEAPTEPPPEWPFNTAAAETATPVRPESRPEPDYTEVVSGTVESGPALSGSIVDDHAYSDRSETDRMTFDRSSFHTVDVIPVDAGSNGQPARAEPDDEPFNVIPLLFRRRRKNASAEEAPPAAHVDEDVDEYVDEDVHEAADEELAADDEQDSDAADEPDASSAPDEPDASNAPDGAFGSEPASYLTAPSAGLSQLGSGGFSVTLFVRELGRSVAFYRDTLGLAEVDTGKSSAVLARGESRILLKRVTDLMPVDRRIVHLNLEVPDVQAAYEELKGKGVEFVHKPRVVSQGEQLELWAATFRDPDGHAIALTRWELRR